MVTSKSAEVGDRILKVTFCFILMEEIWKDVVGYEGLYQVSNLGRVKSLFRIITQNNGQGVIYKRSVKERILKQFLNHMGYYVVMLAKDGVNKTLRVSRLVGMAFLPNPENKPEIDHIDGNPQNNNVNNLQWCTHKENSNNPVRKKRLSTSLKGKKTRLGIPYSQEAKEMFSKLHIRLRGRKVDQYTKEGVFIQSFDCMQNAQKATGIAKQSIFSCCVGKYKSAGGFVWKFKEKK